MTKNLISRRRKKMDYNAERKKSGKSCKKKLEFTFPDADYGPDAAEVQPDLSAEDIAIMLNNHLEGLPDTEEKRKEVFETTIGQSSNSKWLDIRRQMLTASNFGKICKMRETTSCSKLVTQFLYSTFSGKNYAENQSQNGFQIFVQQLLFLYA